MILTGDCLEVMATLDADHFDACLVDPPYEIGLLGRAWDSSGIAFDPATWSAVARVMKPGAHLFAFGSDRTFHRIAVAIEDAGFEIRTCLSWLYGSGVPKGMDAERAMNMAGNDDAADWHGWNTTLRPAWEPIIVARKPMIGSLAENLAAYGTGAFNVNAGRVEGKRWPANVVLDEAAAAMAGPAARYYYTAKADRTERDAGLDGMPLQRTGSYSGQLDGSLGDPPAFGRNAHPSVKPTSVMRWLVRMAVRPRGIVLDPFAGSGTTGVACALEDVRFVGIELSEEYAAVARGRIAEAERVVAGPRQMAF